ncbi:hypothetical protein FIBSPDRAFT_469328 [Athelia psychrophila]|uniref:Uncharacterized protein n=1 Tax=Athelia psychrophila TaxID=1759441 RepID=A0A166LGB1_9AGAM|nr:hypothetical protein FIBSPDRAFT_469328 [Fibularhizoctonia sp. CBS 109695]
MVPVAVDVRRHCQMSWPRQLQGLVSAQSRTGVATLGSPGLLCLGSWDMKSAQGGPSASSDTEGQTLGRDLRGGVYQAQISTQPAHQVGRRFGAAPGSGAAGGRRGYVKARDGASHGASDSVCPRPATRQRTTNMVRAHPYKTAPSPNRNPHHSGLLGTSQSALPTKI